MSMTLVVSPRCSRQRQHVGLRLPNRKPAVAVEAGDLGQVVRAVECERVGVAGASGSFTFSSVPSLRNVQPWNGQVSVDAVVGLAAADHRAAVRARVDQAVQLPSLSRVITTGCRPMYVVK
jgi:hypothetical protein